MSNRTALLAVLAALALAAPAAPLAAEPAHETFRVTNDAHRVVECNLLVNGVTLTYLKVHPGKSYAADFRAQTLLQLSCVRGQQDPFGPLKPGAAYRFTDAPGDHVGLVASPGE